MPEFEPDKFIVVNRKYWNKISAWLKGGVEVALENLKTPHHKYHVVNQDEPYAQKVLDVILEGEKEKNKIPNCPSCEKPWPNSLEKCPHCDEFIKF